MGLLRPALLVVLLMTACSAPVAAPRPLTYVAVGASDAVGVGARDPERDGWVPRFGARLGRDVRVVNLGVSGSTLAQALDEQLGPAVDAHADVITVWLAVNDLNGGVALDRYAQDLNRLLDGLQATHARVLVGNVPDLARQTAAAGRDPGAISGNIDRWNEVIAETVARHGAVLVDLHGSWQEVAEHPEYLSQDGFHPSSEGYARLADVFGEALDGAR
jgi:lysophospholipase L1-like esterase